MARDTAFFKKLMEHIGAQISVCAPAQVVAVHGKTADIKPLFKEDGEEHAVILDALILKHVGAVAKGDIVHVNFTDRALDYLSKKPFDPQLTRRHSMNDAVIVGIYNL